MTLEVCTGDAGGAGDTAAAAVTAAAAAAALATPGVLPLVEGLGASSGFSDSETLEDLRSTSAERMSMPVVGSMIARAAEAFFSVG